MGSCHGAVRLAYSKFLISKVYACARFDDNRSCIRTKESKFGVT